MTLSAFQRALDILFAPPGKRATNLISFLMPPQAYVSMKRITKMLSDEEIDVNAVKRDPAAPHALQIEDGVFSWGGDAQTEHLKE